MLGGSALATDSEDPISEDTIRVYMVLEDTVPEDPVPEDLDYFVVYSHPGKLEISNKNVTIIPCPCATAVVSPLLM
jgi:hypothetical protein